MPFKRGEPRPANAGRKRNSLNKATADVKALARKHGPSAIIELSRLSIEAESEQARVAACKELLDRAYGRPAPNLPDSATAVRGYLIIDDGY